MHGYDREHADIDILHVIERDFGQIVSATCARSAMMVRFQSEESAKRMVDEWDQKILSGHFCICFFADEELQNAYTGRRIGYIRVGRDVLNNVPATSECGWSAYKAIQREMVREGEERESGGTDDWSRPVMREVGGAGRG